MLFDKEYLEKFEGKTSRLLPTNTWGLGVDREKWDGFYKKCIEDGKPWEKHPEMVKDYKRALKEHDRELEEGYVF